MMIDKLIEAIGAPLTVCLMLWLLCGCCALMRLGCGALIVHLTIL